MSEDAAKTFTTNFLTWHNSNGDVHVRTDSQILHIAKTDQELIDKVKILRRGSAIEVAGIRDYSKTLSAFVVRVTKLRPV